MTVVTRTDRPMSTRNRCVIEVLVACLCCVLVFEFYVCIGLNYCPITESDLLFNVANGVAFDVVMGVLPV